MALSSAHTAMVNCDAAVHLALTVNKSMMGMAVCLNTGRGAPRSSAEATQCRIVHRSADHQRLAALHVLLDPLLQPLKACLVIYHCRHGLGATAEGVPFNHSPVMAGNWSMSKSMCSMLRMICSASDRSTSGSSLCVIFACEWCCAAETHERYGLQSDSTCSPCDPTCCRLCSCSVHNRHACKFQPGP
jgi:hypothetical protein